MVSTFSKILAATIVEEEKIPQELEEYFVLYG